MIRLNVRNCLFPPNQKVRSAEMQRPSIGRARNLARPRVGLSPGPASAAFISAAGVQDVDAPPSEINASLRSGNVGLLPFFRAGRQLAAGPLF